MCYVDGLIVWVFGLCVCGGVKFYFDFDLVLIIDWFMDLVC